MKTVFSFAILVTALAGGPVLASSPAPAQQGQAQKKPAAASNAAKPQARKEAPARKAAAPEPDVAGMAAEPYDCDLGRLTIYRKADDNQQIALQWNKRTHQMTRKETSTGAERYESADSGLVWIGIPAKGMLLDSKQGRQVANDCRNETQKKQARN